MKKVIINADLKDLIRDHQSFLERAEIKLFVAGSNREAAELHMVEKADLMICSTSSGSLDGDSLCAMIRKDPKLKDVSIILIGDSDADREHFIEKGANAVLKKSVDRTAIAEKASELLSVAKRIAFRVPVGVKINGLYVKKPFLGYSLNISSSGMLFETEEAIKINDLITCSFFLPDNTHIRADSEITRIAVPKNEYNNTAQYGVKFTELNSMCRNLLDALIHRKLREQKQKLA